MYLFFAWLCEVERIYGRPLSHHHPPPAERRRAVVRRALELSPGGPPHDYFGWLDERVAAWTAGEHLPTTL